VSRLSFTEALDQALELLEQGHPLEYCVRQFPEYADELRPLLQVSDDLHRLAGAPLPFFEKATIEPDWETLLANVPQDQPGLLKRYAVSLAELFKGVQQYRVQRYAAFVVALLVAFVFSWQASRSSTPNSPLYPLKRAVEQVEIVSALDSTSQIELHIELARRRFDELQELAAQTRRIERPLLNEALTETREAVELAKQAGVEEQFYTELSQLLSDAHSSISLLKEAVTAPEVLESAGDTVSELRDDLEGTSIAQAATATPTIVNATPTPTATNLATPTATIERSPLPTATLPANQTEETKPVVPAKTPTPIAPQPTQTPVPTTRPVTATPVPATSIPTQQPPRVPTAVPTVGLPPVVPTLPPTLIPTLEPTAIPTVVPTLEPTPIPTDVPTEVPTVEPTAVPTVEPTPVPTVEPTPVPTAVPTEQPTEQPTAVPTPPIPTVQITVTIVVPTEQPTVEPTAEPTVQPTVEPTGQPAPQPTTEPSPTPVPVPSETATTDPTLAIEPASENANGVALRSSQTYAGRGVNRRLSGARLRTTQEVKTKPISRVQLQSTLQDVITGGVTQPSRQSHIPVSSQLNTQAVLPPDVEQSLARLKLRTRDRQSEPKP